MNNPDLYSRNNKFQRQIVTQVIQEHLQDFQWRKDNQDSLIDVGSGSGDMLMEVICPLLNKNFHRIVCSDLSPIMVEYARCHFSHVKNSEFIQFDIDTDVEIPPNLKGKFDHVVSFYCLHLSQNQMRAFKNIYHLLRADDGGDCLLNLFARGPYYDAYLKLSTISKWSRYMQEIEKYTSYWHYAVNPEREARNMLEKCGFIDVKVNICQKYYDFENIQTFKEVILAVSHYTHKIPEDLHQDFLDDFVKALTLADNKCRELNGCGSKFRFYFEQLVIFARRPPV